MSVKLPKRELKKLLRSLEKSIGNLNLPQSGNSIGNLDEISSGLEGNQALGVSSSGISDLIRELIKAILDALRPTPPEPPVSGPVEGLANAARTYQENNVPVTIVTTAGTASGFVSEVGDDYVLLIEPSGSQLLVNLNNAYAIYPLGLE